MQYVKEEEEEENKISLESLHHYDIQICRYKGFYHEKLLFILLIQVLICINLMQECIDIDVNFEFFCRKIPSLFHKVRALTTSRWSAGAAPCPRSVSSPPARGRQAPWWAETQSRWRNYPEWRAPVIPGSGKNVETYNLKKADH